MEHVEKTAVQVASGLPLGPSIPASQPRLENADMGCMPIGGGGDDEMFATCQKIVLMKLREACAQRDPCRSSTSALFTETVSAIHSILACISAVRKSGKVDEDRV
jgi:hypothetical protein